MKGWVQGAHWGDYGEAEGEVGHFEAEENRLLGMKTEDPPGDQVPAPAPCWPGQTETDPGSGFAADHRKVFGKERQGRTFGLKVWVM